MRPGDCLRTAFFYHLSRLAGRGAFPAAPGGDPAGQLSRPVGREGPEAGHGQVIGKKGEGGLRVIEEHEPGLQQHIGEQPLSLIHI